MKIDFLWKKTELLFHEQSFWESKLNIQMISSVFIDGQLVIIPFDISVGELFIM
jgi:hypothetical protein